MVTTRQTQAATTTLNASQIRRSVIFGRPHAHPSRSNNAYRPLAVPIKAPIFSLAQLAACRVVNGWTVQVMNKKAIIEPFVGMASLVCLASGPRHA